jgi:D-glycero-D-manno-heptose 1,7-bisphosphate phosphatase
VGRGIIDEPFVHAVHHEIDRRLEPAGARIDGYYYCPHFAESTIERYRQECRCRKPGPGMIEQACRELDLDPAKSFVVGDRWLDVACGRAAGVNGALLVRSGPERTDPPDGIRADAVVSNLVEAVGWILRTAR